MTIENEGVVDVSDEDDFAAITSGKPVEAPAAPEPVEAVSEAPKPAEAVKPEVMPEQMRDDPRVPVGELVATRKRAQEAEKREAALQSQLAELIAAINANAPKPPAPPAPDIFENPDAFVRQQVQPIVSSYEQRIQHLARENAEVRFGEDKVAEAERRFFEFLNSGRLPQHEYAQVVDAPNRYAAVVQWLDQRTLLEEVGTDRQAFLKKQRQSLLNDPEFRKEAMAAWQAEARSNPSRSPVIELPSLSKVGAASLPSGDQNGMSDDDEWRSIMSRKR